MKTMLRNGLLATALVATAAFSGASVAPQPANAFIGVRVGGVHVGVGPRWHRGYGWRRGYGWHRGLGWHRGWRRGARCRYGRCW